MRSLCGCLTTLSWHVWMLALVSAFSVVVRSQPNFWHMWCHALSTNHLRLLKCTSKWVLALMLLTVEQLILTDQSVHVLRVNFLWCCDAEFVVWSIWINVAVGRISTGWRHTALKTQRQHLNPGYSGLNSWGTTLRLRSVLRPVTTHPTLLVPGTLY